MAIELVGKAVVGGQKQAARELNGSAADRARSDEQTAGITTGTH